MFYWWSSFPPTRISNCSLGVTEYLEGIYRAEQSAGSLLSVVGIALNWVIFTNLIFQGFALDQGTPIGKRPTTFQLEPAGLTQEAGYSNFE